MKVVKSWKPIYFIYMLEGKIKVNNVDTCLHLFYPINKMSRGQWGD